MQIEAVQEWEGYVVEVDDEAFVARLVDLRAGATCAGEEAVIPFTEINPEDAARMRIGSIFRWVVGYTPSPDGVRNRVSQIVFPETPKVTRADLEEDKAWARKIARSFAS